MLLDIHRGIEFLAFLQRDGFILQFGATHRNSQRAENYRL